MTKLTKGNFTPKKEASAEKPKEDSRKEWEKSMLSKLGGSIAFTRDTKGKFVSDAKK